MVAVYYAGQPVPPQRIALDVSKNLQRELQRLDEQAAIILSNLEDGRTWTPPTSQAYSFFLFESSRLIEWSNNDFVPTAASVAETFSMKLLKAGNGNYLAKKWKLKDARFLVGVVPLIRNYSITNDYLKTAWNDRVFPSSNFDILEPDANLGLPVCIGDECVFRVSFLQNELPTHRKDEGHSRSSDFLFNHCADGDRLSLH